MFKKLSALFVVVLVAGLLTPLSAGAQEPGVLRLAHTEEPEHFNPFRSITVATRSILTQTYEALARYDPASEGIVPELAESWDISDDGLVYTFHLRQGVLFQEHEGVTYESREVTAADWLWSMKTFLSGDTEVSAHPEYLAAVKGAPEFTAGAAEDVEGLVALDDYTLQITLSAPNHRFILDLINVNVVPQEAYEQLGDAFNNTTVGTGPFRVKEWFRDDRIVLEKNPEYWEEGLPLLDQIISYNVPDANNHVLMYRQNEIDVLGNFPAGQRTALLEEFAAEAHEGPGLNVNYYSFDMGSGFFAGEEKKLVRQAMNYAINRDEMWNVLMEGSRLPGNQGVLLPSMPAADVEGYPYDLEKAKQLLADAGYPNGEGIPEFDQWVLGSSAQNPFHAALQAYLAEIGIKTTIKVVDNTTYWSDIEGEDCIFFFSGWSADFNDPSEVFNFLLYDGIDLATNYNNDEVDRLLDLAPTIVDDEERNAVYRQAHEIIMDEAPWIVLSYSKVTYLAKPWVEGYVVGAAGGYRTPLKYVSITG